MLSGLYLKPPGTVWIGQVFVPLRLLFGSVEPALLFSILVTQAVLLALIYRMSRLLCPNSQAVALIAVAAASGTQAFVALSHQYVVEPLQGVAVAWVVWIAVERDWPPARTLIHLAGATLLGILAKASTPLYSLIPTVVVLGSLLYNRRRWDFRAEWRRISSNLIVLFLLVGGTFGALWYKRNFAYVLQHVRDSSSGDIALAYGFRAPPWEKFAVWLRYFDQAFLSPFLTWIVAVAALALGVFFFLRRRSLEESRLRPAAALLSILQILIVLCAFALNDAVETRYLFALLPYVAILFIVLFSAARNPVLLGTIFLVSIAQLGITNWASFAPTALRNDRFPWLRVFQADPVPYREISEVAKRTSLAPGYNIVAVELPWLNANSMAFFAGKNRLKTGVQSYYTSLGYAEKDPKAALRRIDDFKARFVITLDEPFQPPPDFLNLVALPVLRALKTSEDYTQISFPSQKGVLVFERRNGASASKAER